MTDERPYRRRRTDRWPRRKAKLMMCALSRLALPVLGIPELWAVVEAAEGFADGEVTADQLRAAAERARAAVPPASDEPRHTLAEVVRRGAVWRDPPSGEPFPLDPQDLHNFATPLFGYLELLLGEPATPGWAELFDDLEPRAAAFDPAWRTETVALLARRMYEERDFSAMPVLADALQDAGCDDEEVLAHCRGGGPHYRGCWAVDLVLGKE